MKVREHWRSLGAHHALWDLLRYYRAIAASRRRGAGDEWLSSVKRGAFKAFPVADGNLDALERYLVDCRKDLDSAFGLLRTEDEAIAHAETMGLIVEQTRTRNEDHHQSAKALVAAVSGIALRATKAHGVGCNPNPQGRAVWFTSGLLHVTARNLDGAIPSLENPFVVWEIKEYWGKTNGGSKMSDAVYECNLVGLELRSYESRGGRKVDHVVFLDGRDQWLSRRSDMVRFIDLFHQGLIDQLVVGREVETNWNAFLEDCIARNTEA